MKILCKLCPLHADCNSPVFGDGPIPCDILMVGEAPGHDEDQQGLPFVGKTGKFLRGVVNTVNDDGLKVRYTNVVRCRPPKNRKPTKKELETCRFWLDLEIKRCRPKAVVLLGGTATQSMLGESSIKRVRGRKIIRDGITFFPTYHPSYILNYNKGNVQAEKEFQQDIISAFSVGIESMEKVDVNIVSPGYALEILQELNDGTKVAFDIEATTTDPYLTEAKILCLSFHIGNGETYCFDWGKDRDQINVLKELTRFNLIAQNGKYDCEYVEVLTGVRLIDNLFADTMLMQYALDEREPKGLKSMVAKYLPQYSGYESEVNKFSNNDEGFVGVPSEILMQYCGTDSFVTWELYKVLKDKVEDYGVGDYFYDVLMPGIRMLGSVQQNGCKLDSKAITSVERKLDADIELTQSQILRFDSVKRWCKDNQLLKWKSPKFLEETIFTLQRIKPTESTPTGRPKLDIETLEKLENPLADKFVHLSKLQKMRSTYSGDSIRESWIRPRTGLCHTTFGFEAGTGRLSSRNPNLQNVPNPKKSSYGRDYNIRSYFVSRYECGNLLSADYKAIELRVFTVLVDCRFYKEIFSRNGDPHGEMASKINGIKLSDVTPDQREDAKTANFESLYGTTAYGMMKTHGKTVLYWEEFLREHLKVIPELGEYRKAIKNDLKNKGYVESPFGARRHFEYSYARGDFQKGEIERAAYNHPVQNAASNLTLLSACAIDKELHGKKSAIINLIHDCILIDWSPNLHEVIIPRQVKQIMEDHKQDWLKLPTPVDITITPNWGGESHES